MALCSFLNSPPTTADKALGPALDERSTTRLAEIFLLRMEAIYRASEESAPTGNSRFGSYHGAAFFSTPITHMTENLTPSGHQGATRRC